MATEARDWKGNPGIACPECGEFIPVEDDSSWPPPIPVSERPPEVGESALFYFPGVMKIWTEDGTDPFIADARDVKGDSGQWIMLTLHADGWLRCHGTNLKLSDATHYLPLPPKPKRPASPSKDERPWVLEHAYRSNPSAVRTWHKYPDQYGSAVCGHPPIPGMPICAEQPMGTIAAARVCKTCLGL